MESEDCLVNLIASPPPPLQWPIRADFSKVTDLGMEEEPAHTQHASVPSSSTSINASSSSSSSLSLEVHEEEPDQRRDEEEEEHHHYHHHHHHHHHHQQPSGVSYRLNISISDGGSSTEMRDDVWSCLVVLVTFWFFAASMTLILGFYGSVNLQLGPNCSRLIQANPFFVQSIKVQEIDQSKTGPILYGFYKPPPLDVKITWSETHDASIQASLHKEWIFFLNKGSAVDISYNVEYPRSSPLSLVIAQSRESLVEWVDDPSYPNTTLSWNIIYGSGKIQQEIFTSSNYYIAVGNLNSEDVEVQLNFTIEAFVYNTTQAYYKCYLSNRLCSLKLFLLRANAAVLTSPGSEQGKPDDNWYLKLSYGARWITYFAGSGVMTVLILLAFRFCNIFHPVSGDGTGFQAGEVGSERAPLLSPKDDDLSSWGSSYDSISHDEEDLEERRAGGSIEGKQLKEGENNTQRLCVICFDAPRDCFFLPCGHCAACFTCGTRIAEEAGNCPICRRTMKKVRKIFTV